MCVAMIRHEVGERDEVHSETVRDGAEGRVISTVIVRVTASDVRPAMSAATIPSVTTPSGRARLTDQFSPTAVVEALELPYTITTTESDVVVPLTVTLVVANTAASRGDSTNRGVGGAAGSGAVPPKETLPLKSGAVTEDGGSGWGGGGCVGNVGGGTAGICGTGTGVGVGTIGTGETPSVFIETGGGEGAGS